jgi:hypothetical protein
MELLIFIAGYACGVVSVFVAIWTGMRLRDRKPHMTWPDVQRHIEEGRAMALQGDYQPINDHERTCPDCLRVIREEREGMR